MLFSDNLQQENYYQMPFLVFVCIAISYALFGISEMMQKVIKKNFFLLAIILTGLAFASVYQSITRMHAAVFYGLDVAGESLK